MVLRSFKYPATKTRARRGCIQTPRQTLEKPSPSRKRLNRL